MDNMGAGSALLNATKILKDAGLTGGSKIADFGAGRAGHMVFPAARLVGEKGMVYAVDVVKDVIRMIDTKRQMFSILNLQTVWGDFEMKGGVKIPPQSLDYVLIVNNLWCVKNMDAVISESKRLLKKDGKVVLVDWRRRIEHPVAPPVQNRLDAMQAEAVFLKNGFKKERDLPVGETHWGMILSSAQ